MNTFIFNRSSKRKRGFSLIEVALALGIISVAFIPLLGLMGTGLTVSRETAQDTVIQQIRAQVEATVRLMDFATISNSNFKNEYYWSEDGRQLDTSEKADALYKATVQYNTLDTATSSMSSSLAKLQVSINFAPHGTVQPNVATKTSFLVVSKN